MISKSIKCLFKLLYINILPTIGFGSFLLIIKLQKP